MRYTDEEIFGMYHRGSGWGEQLEEDHVQARADRKTLAIQIAAFVREHDACKAGQCGDAVRWATWGALLRQMGYSVDELLKELA